MKLVALLFVFALTASAHDFSDCGSVQASVSTLTMTPDPPVPGQTLSITITGTLTNAITSGSAVVTATYLGIQVIDQTLDICKLISGGCPTTAGPFTATYSTPLTSAAPAGAYDVKLTASTNTASALCLTTSFNIGGSSSMEAVEDLSKTLVFSPVTGKFTLGDHPFSDCGSQGVTVNSVVFDPYPPVPGKQMTITLTGSLAHAASSGTINIDATYIGISVLNENKNLCDLLSGGCPAAAGAFTADYSTGLTSAAPAGTYTATISGSTNAGDKICISSSFAIGA